MLELRPLLTLTPTFGTDATRRSVARRGRTILPNDKDLSIPAGVTPREYRLGEARALAVACCG